MNPKGKGIAAAVEEATKTADEIAKTKPERLDPKPAEEESSKRKHEGEEEKPKKKVKKEGDEDKPKKKVKKEGDEDKPKKNAKNDDEKEKGEKKRKNKDEGDNKEKKKKPSKCLLPLVINLIYLFLPLFYSCLFLPAMYNLIFLTEIALEEVPKSPLELEVIQLNYKLGKERNNEVCRSWECC